MKNSFATEGISENLSFVGFQFSRVEALLWKREWHVDISFYMRTKVMPL